jgi:hypothetical protein
MIFDTDLMEYERIINRTPYLQFLSVIINKKTTKTNSGNRNRSKEIVKLFPISTCDWDRKLLNKDIALIVAGVIKPMIANK